MSGQDGRPLVLNRQFLNAIYNDSCHMKEMMLETVNLMTAPIDN